MKQINWESLRVQAAKAEKATASFLYSVQGIRMTCEGMSISTASSTRKWAASLVPLIYVSQVGSLTAGHCCCRFSRFTIAVGAVGKDGKHASYSVRCAVPTKAIVGVLTVPNVGLSFTRCCVGHADSGISSVCCRARGRQRVSFRQYCCQARRWLCEFLLL